MRRIRDSRGQVSSEWVGLVLVVVLAFASLQVAGARVPGTALAVAIAKKIACAASLGEGCGGEASDLVLAYGPELAALVGEHLPRLDYEEGMRALPVDFRSCRDDGCAEGGQRGAVQASLAGEPVTVFTHVIDCRRPAAAERDGFGCDGERLGKVYLQYWLYYPGSHTSFWGEAGHHADDFESLQVRVGPDGVEARASSHNGYNGHSADPINDIAFTPKQSGWSDATGRYSISGGSHAGRVGAPPGAPVRRPSSLPSGPPRWTEAAAIRVIPLSSLRDAWDDYEFEVTPPWDKEVFRDPESRRT